METTLGPKQYTYYLRSPDSRPNPFRISANVVFVNGVWTSILESATIDEADKMLAAYGASREVPEWAQEESDDGISDDEQNGTPVSGGETDTESQVSPDGETSEETDDDGEANAASDPGNEGSGTGEAGGEGAADKPVEPPKVKKTRRRKKDVDPDDLA